MGSERASADRRLVVMRECDCAASGRIFRQRNAGCRAKITMPPEKFMAVCNRNAE